MVALCICFSIGLINLALIEAINNKDTRDVFEQLEDVSNQIEDMKKKDERLGNFTENVCNGVMDGRFSPMIVRLFIFILVSLPFLNIIFLISFLKDLLTN
ncbi:MAG: hypothetical protein ACI3T9_07965 [Romboutsia timonensis]